MQTLIRATVRRCAPFAVVPALALAVATCSAPADAAAASTTARLTAAADTYTNTAHAATVYGSAIDLRVGAGATGTKNAFLQFAIPAEDTTRVASAQLILTRTDHHLPVTTVTASRTSPTWSEARATAATAPVLGPPLDTQSVNGSLTTVAFDVTAAVKGQTSVGIGLSSPISTDVAIFASREAATGGPTLVLTLDPVPPPPACTVSPILVSSCQVWLGDTPQAYTHTLFTPSSRLAVDEGFTGRKFDILHEYNTNSTLFPSAASIALSNQGRMLSENWKPATDMTWAQVAAGNADARIDAEAAYLKSNVTKPFFLTVYHEPEDNVIATAGSGMTVADYVAMYRHTVQRLRADGATMFVTVMNYMGYYRWDSMRDALYPGDDVVNWIAYDPYMYGPSNQAGHDFAAMVNTGHNGSLGFYDWATTKHPGTPLMLGEWGAYDNMLSTNPLGQAQFYATIVPELSRFPALRAVDHFTMNPIDVPAGSGTSPTETAAGLTAWQQAAAAPIFTTPATG